MIQYRREQLIAEELEGDIDVILSKMEALVEDIDYEGVTEGQLGLLGKQMKQIKTLKNRASKITQYMNDLINYNNTEEELQAEKDSFDYKYRNLTPEQRKKVASVSYVLMHSNVIDRMTLSLNKIDKESVELFCDLFNIEYGADSHGSWEWLYFLKDGKRLDHDELLAMVATYRDEDFEDKDESNEESNTSESKEEDEEEKIQDYGWLSPSGEYVESGFGTHEESAINIIKDKGWKAEYDALYEKQFMLARDFLVNNKGYALLHNPFVLGPTKVEEPTRLTKAQKEFLFDYFVNEHEEGRANYYIQEA